MLNHPKKQRAIAMLQAGQFHAAKNLLEEIVRADRNDLDSWMNLAIVNSQVGAVNEVERCCRQAISIRPDIVEAHFNLGVALYMQGKTAEAALSYRQVLKLNPDHILAQFNLGKSLEAALQLEEALTCFERTLKIKPKPGANLPKDFISTVYHAIASTLKAQGRIPESVENHRKALQLNPGLTKAHTDLLLTLNYDSTDAAAVFNEHVRWGKNNSPASLPNIPHTNSTDLDRPLRVGYVSPDLYRHSVAFFFEPLLAAHDRSRIFPICYAESWKQDEVSQRLRSLTPLWRDTCAMNDEQMASQIRADAVDILVDLAGHTAKSRLTVFSRKPAPIQVSYLGYPNTTGLATMDYRFTDTVADPQRLTDDYYTEKLVRLPHGFLCYLPPENAPDIGSLPSLSAGYITFGSFNNISKITTDVIALWSKILHAVPGSRLILKTSSFKDIATQQRVYQKFSQHGVTEARVELRGPIWDISNHQAVYNEIDIALDPFPYNGTTTTYEALWMGVPVITLAGNMHAGRVGASILTQIGLPAHIANGPEDYLRIAVELSGSKEYLSELRSNLRQRISGSPMCNAEVLAHDIEEAYRTMWSSWREARNNKKS